MATNDLLKNLLAGQAMTATATHTHTGGLGIYSQDPLAIYQPTLTYPTTINIHPGQPVGTIANIRIEKIENGYIIVFSKQGVAEKRVFAGTMADVGEACIRACTQLELSDVKP